jgi:hypothetical protein
MQGRKKAMDFIKLHLCFMTGKGYYSCGKAKESLTLMKATTAQILFFWRLQACRNRPQRGDAYAGAHMPSDDELMR